jgi:hypothetical protein
MHIYIYIYMYILYTKYNMSGACYDKAIHLQGDALTFKGKHF